MGIALVLAIILVWLAAFIASKVVWDTYEDDPYDFFDIGSLDPYEETVVIRSANSLYAGTQMLEGDTYDDNYWTQMYADDLNIDIQFDFTTTTNMYHDKLGAAIAGGDLPDMFQTDINQMQTLLDSNLIFSDLAPIFDHYATPLLKEITGWATYDEEGNVISEPGLEHPAFKAFVQDGKLKAIPWTTGFDDSATYLFIRADWLAEVGLPVPTTVDELEDVLRAFTSTNLTPSGTKPFGLVANKDNIFAGANSFAPIFNAYGAYPSIWVQDGEGGIVYGPTQEAMREPIERLRQWYADGLIWKDSFTASSDDAYAVIQSGKAGIYLGHNNGFGKPCNTSKEMDPDMEWIVCPVPRLDADTPTSVAMTSSITRCFVVKKRCEHPEALIRMLNLFVEKMWGEDESTATISQNASSYAPFQVWSEMKNYNVSMRVTEVIDNVLYNNGEGLGYDDLNGEQKRYYNYIMAYIESDRNLANFPEDSPYAPIDCWMFTRLFYRDRAINTREDQTFEQYQYREGCFDAQGNRMDIECTYSVLDRIFENNWYVFDEWYGIDPPAYSSYRKTVESRINQAIFKAIMGTDTVDAYFDVVDNDPYLKQITEEVNEVYRSR